MRKFLILGMGCLFLVSCADLSHDLVKQAQSLDQVIKMAHDQLAARLQAIQLDLMTGKVAQAQIDIKKAQKEVDSAYARIQKYDADLDKTATEAAKQADAAKKLRPTFLQSINPGYWFGRSWDDAKEGFKVLAGWLGIGIVIIIVLELTSGASPIVAAVLKFLGMILGHLISLFSNIADGVLTVIEKSTTPTASKI